jgi:aminobenzoyl-glutamate utilization protein B
MCVFTTACWPLGCAPHTWQAAAAAGSGIGRKGMHYAAKIIAGIGFDLLKNTELDKKIIEEFKQKRNTNYVPQC